MWMERERKCLHMGLEQRGVGRWRAGDGEGAAISSHEDAVERWGDTAKKKKKGGISVPVLFNMEELLDPEC